MATVHLWDQTAINPTTTGAWGNGGGHFLGIAFWAPTSQTTITGYRYFYPDLQTSRKPDRIFVLHGLPGGLGVERLAVLRNPDMPTQTGWCDYTPPYNVTIQPRHVYAICAHWPQFGTSVINQNSTFPTPVPGPLQLIHPEGVDQDGGGSDGTPAQWNTVSPPLLDIAYEGSVTPLPATPNDLDQKLSDWLSASAGTHNDSTPLLTYSLANTNLPVLTNPGYGNAALLAFLSGIYGAQSISTWSLKEISDAIQLLSAAVDLINKLLGGPSGKEPSAVVYPDGSLIRDVILQTGTNVTDILFLARRLANQFPYPDTTHWTLVDETTFTDELVWGVEAELYVVTITQKPDSVPDVVLSGYHWYPRLGWWTVITDTFLESRQFLEFQEQKLHQPGFQKMPGLFLHCKPGTQGHVQAWSFLG